MNSALDKIFRLKKHGTNVKTEVLAGITTFLTMAYIIIVNPAILSNAGMPFSGVLFFPFMFLSPLLSYKNRKVDKPLK